MAAKLTVHDPRGYPPKVVGKRLLVMDPLAARGFVELGFDTKEKLIEWCAENARLTAREYWDNQWIQYLMRPRAVAGVESSRRG